MGAQEIQQSQSHQVVMNRFVAACQADERVVAAFLGGSYARDTTDAYSDLDFGLIITDEAYDDFFAGRAAFIRRLGEQATFCPMEQGAMLQATLVIVRFYRELAPSLARAHGIPYPADLERVMYERLKKLCGASLS